MSIKFLSETPKRETLEKNVCLVVMESRIFYGILCNPSSRFHVNFITLFQMPFWGAFFQGLKNFFSGQENIFFWAGKKIALGRHFFAFGIYLCFEYRKSGKMLHANKNVELGTVLGC